MIYLHPKFGRIWTCGSWDMKQREIPFVRMRIVSVLQGSWMIIWTEYMGVNKSQQWHYTF